MVSPRKRLNRENKKKAPKVESRIKEAQLDEAESSHRGIKRETKKDQGPITEEQLSDAETRDETNEEKSPSPIIKQEFFGPSFELDLPQSEQHPQSNMTHQDQKAEDHSDDEHQTLISQIQHGQSASGAGSVTMPSASRKLRSGNSILQPRRTRGGPVSSFTRDDGNGQGESYEASLESTHSDSSGSSRQILAARPRTRSNIVINTTGAATVSGRVVPEPERVVNPGGAPVFAPSRAHELKQHLLNPRSNKRPSEIDPENSEIRRLRVEEKMGWGAIATQLNTARIATGKEPIFTDSAVYSRYVRTNAFLASLAAEESEKEDFPQIRRQRTSAVAAPPFNTVHDEPLIEAYEFVTKSFWEDVSKRLEMKTGKKYTADQCARRFDLI